MNHHDEPTDELTRALGRELHDQVDDLNRAPFVLGDVKLRAGRIRRNRRLAAGAGVAAAVAIIVPAAMLAGVGADRAGTGPGPGPAITGPSDGPAAHTTLTLDGLTRGDAPGIEYFTPDGVVLPEQGMVEQRQRWQGLVRSEADGGWLAYGPGRDEVRYLSEEFAQQGGSSAGDAFVADAGRDRVAWTAGEGGAQTLVLHSTTEPGTDRTWHFPAQPQVSPVGILDGERVVFETTDQQTGRSTVAIAEPDGSISPFAHVAGAVAVSSDGLVSVLTRPQGDFGACFGIVDTAVDATRVAWETCERSLSTFSPDGRHVLAGPAYLDGVGDREAVILDARTHEVVADFDQPRNGELIVGQHAWESDDSVLAVASDGPRQTVLRLGVDGTLEQATDVAGVSLMEDMAFWFGADRAAR